MPRLKGSADLLEDRRKRALALLDSGYSLNEVGRRIGCNASSVMRWRNARRKRGAEGLRVRFSPGRPWKLDRKQRQRLVQLLLQGPMMHGYRTNLWTTARIAELIDREFGIHYHRDHVGRLLHSLKWSPQKPERRALERNDEAIEHWKQKHWPRIKKRYAAGCPPSLRRRVGLSLDPARRQDVVPARLYSGSLSSPGTPRQGLGHFRNLRKSPPTGPGPVLSTLLRQYRAGGSLPVSSGVVAPSARSGHRLAGQFFHPPGAASATTSATTSPAVHRALSCLCPGAKPR